MYRTEKKRHIKQKNNTAKKSKTIQLKNVIPPKRSYHPDEFLVVPNYSNTGMLSQHIRPHLAC